MAKRSIGWAIFALCSLLSACAEREDLAPVTDSAIHERSYYVSQEGDTLFSIAWAFDKDFRELAYYNHLDDDAKLSAGQKIYLVPKRAIKEKWQKEEHLPQKRPKVFVKTRWLWPTKGHVVRYFSPTHHQKGLNIRGTLGQAIFASKSGRVAYSGDGLRGYGNLIILKHPGNYLSAYGFNSRNLVKEGQYIKAGKKIAEMGKYGLKKGMLHFEIRYKGRPINPLKLLPSH